MRILLIMTLGFLLSACASTTQKKNPPVLQTWNTVGQNIWSVSDGVLISSAEPGKSYLVSPNAYTNFRLELEFKPDANVNSGVFVNCETSTEISSKTCFEANIADNHKTPESRTGSIVGHAPPATKQDTIGKWNTLAVTINDGKVIVKVNGVKTAETSSTAHPRGFVGLQRFKDGVIQFRNVTITRI